MTKVSNKTVKKAAPKKGVAKNKKMIKKGSKKLNSPTTLSTSPSFDSLLL